MKTRLFAAAGLSLALFLPMTNAATHGIWVAQRTGDLTIVYGHLAEDEAYETKKVKSVEGFTAAGAQRPVVLVPGDKNVTLKVPEDVAVLATRFDNGFWIKAADGQWQNVGKKQVPGGTESHQPLKYNLHILGPVRAPLKPTGAALEILPLVDPTGLKVGDPLPVQVLFKGAPYAGALVINDYVNNAEVTTPAGADGRVTLKVTSAGLNVVAVEHTEKTPDNADVDEVYSMATLSYTLPHVE